LGFPASLSACGYPHNSKGKLRAMPRPLIVTQLKHTPVDKRSLSDEHMSLLCLIVEDEYRDAMEEHGWLTVNHKPNCRLVRKGADCDCKPTTQATDAFLNAPGRRRAAVLR
jgi:hypothetical protein